MAVADGINFSAVPGILFFFPSRPQDIDGRDKPGHDENDAIGIVPYMLTIELALCTSMNSPVALSRIDSAPVATPK